MATPEVGGTPARGPAGNGYDARYVEDFVSPEPIYQPSALSESERGEHEAAVGAWPPKDAPGFAQIAAAKAAAAAQRAAEAEADLTPHASPSPADAHVPDTPPPRPAEATARTGERDAQSIERAADAEADAAAAAAATARRPPPPPPITLAPVPAAPPDEPYKPSDAPSRPYRDVGFAAAWLASLLCVLGILSGYGGRLAGEAAAAAEAGIPVGPRALDISRFVGGLCGCLLVVAVWSAAYLQLALRSAPLLVAVSLYGSLVASFALMVVVFATAGPVGVVFLFVFLLDCWYVYHARKLMPLAATQLRVAACALRAFPATSWLPYPWMAVESAWLLLWLWAYALAVQASANGLCHAFLVGHVCWTSQVLAHTLHATVAGAVGAWCFQGASAPAETVTLAFRRHAERAGGAPAPRRCVDSLDRLLGALDRALCSFNRYAFTRVALYGEPFAVAASRAVELVRARGLEPLLRDDAAGAVLMLGCVVGGALSGALACLIALGSASTGGARVLAALLGFLVGVLATQQATAGLQGAVAAVFISYVEDPATLARTHPDEYQQLTDAYTQVYPEAMAKQEQYGAGSLHV